MCPDPSRNVNNFLIVFEYSDYVINVLGPIRGRNICMCVIPKARVVFDMTSQWITKMLIAAKMSPDA